MGLKSGVYLYHAEPNYAKPNRVAIHFTLQRKVSEINRTLYHAAASDRVSEVSGHCLTPWRVRNELMAHKARRVISVVYSWSQASDKATSYSLRALNRVLNRRPESDRSERECPAANPAACRWRLTKYNYVIRVSVFFSRHLPHVVSRLMCVIGLFPFLWHVLCEIRFGSCTSYRTNIVLLLAILHWK